MPPSRFGSHEYNRNAKEWNSTRRGLEPSSILYKIDIFILNRLFPAEGATFIVVDARCSGTAQAHLRLYYDSTRGGNELLLLISNSTTRMSATDDPSPPSVLAARRTWVR